MTHSIPFARCPRYSALTLALALSASAAAHAEEPALDLAPIDVSGTALPSTPASEQRGYTVKRTTSATGLNLTPRQTPQSVSTITQQQMTDRQIGTLEQALETTPGVSMSKSEVGGRTDYRARGYSISNWKVDGLQYQGATGFSGGGAAMNMDLYERIDIVRGANGLLGGTGDPSATVNLIRKRPTREFGGSAWATYGSWDKQRTGADLNLPLSADGRLRSRLVVTEQQANAFRDQQSDRSRAALANLEFDLTESTTLGAGFQYEYYKIVGGGWGANIPLWYGNGQKTDLPRSTNVAPSWSFGEYTTRTGFASLAHRFDNDWSLNLRAAQSESDVLNHRGVAKVNSAGAGRYGGYWNQDGTGAVLNALHSSTDSTQQSAQLDLSGPFQALGREHQAMFGYSDSRTVDWTPQYNCRMFNATRTSAVSTNCQFRANNGFAISDWGNGVDDDIRLDAWKTGLHSKTVTRLSGLYGATRLSVTDPLSIIIGARVSDYSATTTATSGSRATGHESGIVTPYLGAVYDLNAHYSLYASYTDIFTPQTSQTTGGSPVEPIRGKSYETGIKGEWFDGGLNAQVAYFRTQQQNKAVMDGANTTPSGAQAYVAGTGVETDGIDLELSGAITPAWNVYAGYTWLHFRRVDSDGRSDPSHLFKLSSTYRLPGRLDRLTLGAGVNAQSNIRALSSPAGQPANGTSSGTTEVNWSGYAIWNAMARYDLTDNTTVTLNANNLFDKHYYTQYGFYAGAIYGDPRNLQVTVRTRF
ncbi:MULTISPECIES: TonB-dependent siderophore receptor [unclassified Pseudomonas]|uniref:TonB-dependent siderophore receptor n=1 Tax=unclassified Pseudomonas TaxID=196821 RepID=UPI000BCC5FDE|nr:MULTISPECIES: TonB-dependent siderophore receptor [unclassified Pseudomonas]PVZ13635.1 outer membrane receptor for ferric coprogen and ferric-rhodotorulic acid [Pseudomonas sp. URIL14HWK12:I12]PVZ23941.1 outer membrane receptor for ferric coprogen and ferric-rhodotorulic acid [Pseudomonas sp. URIL14HWK12:I10]PVZ33420.1 outer membrane receptor for ferric coprogen and ferric-rhodotorulic acid [Pseudomonas sp. URIL14HWK12:I11]SNZ11497.1 outer-membrane receptor for ferric coprogen and ferric-rho